MVEACGSRWTVDIEVEDEGQYITEGGFINQNCWQGWEELCTWPDDQCYKRMFSCARSTNPKVPIRIRATCNPYGCVPHGDVLTKRGWKGIKSVKVGDQVYGTDADGNIKLQTVEAVIKQDWNGSLVRRKGKGVDMTFTPDHRLPMMLSADRHEVRQYDSLPWTSLIRRTGKPMGGPGAEELKKLMKGKGVVTTTSRSVRNRIQKLATLQGFSTKATLRERGRWEVAVSNKHTTPMIHGWGEGNCKTELYEGPVYCLSVPETETFFIRQNGSVWLSGNSGHNWVKSRWKLPIHPDRIYGEVQRFNLEDSDEVLERVAIHGELAENKLLLFADPNYVGRLREAARNEAELRAWLYGDWDIVAGGMFDDVWKPEFHVLPNFDLSTIPRGWRIDRSYDHGQSKPFSVGWWAESNGEPMEVEGRYIGAVAGDLIRIAEWYGWNGRPNEGLRMTSPEIATGILRLENEMGIKGRVRAGAADSSIFDKYEAQKSVAGDMRKYGVRWEPIDKGPGSRMQGWEQMRKMMRASIPKQGVREEPGLFILDCCEQFKRTIPVLPRDDRNLDDVDTEAEDHVGDEVRYRLRIKRRTSRIFGWK